MSHKSSRALHFTAGTLVLLPSWLSDTHCVRLCTSSSARLPVVRRMNQGWAPEKSTSAKVEGVSLCVPRSFPPTQGSRILSQAFEETPYWFPCPSTISADSLPAQASFQRGETPRIHKTPRKACKLQSQITVKHRTLSGDSTQGKELCT